MKKSELLAKLQALPLNAKELLPHEKPTFLKANFIMLLLAYLDDDEITLGFIDANLEIIAQQNKQDLNDLTNGTWKTMSD